MKKTLLILMSLAIQTIVAQSVGTVDNHPSQPINLVVFTFGMDNPIAVGTMSSSGELNFNLPVIPKTISENVKSNFLSDATFTLFSKCDNSNEMLSEQDNVKSVSGGYISLSNKENPYMGLIFMVSDAEIVPWLESYGDVDAVTGSYYELFYLEKDLNYQGDCTSTVSFTGNDSNLTHYEYNLQLKAGFNLIEHTIESVEAQEVPNMYIEGKMDTIKKPTKIKVTSSHSIPPNTKYISKYF